MIKLAFLCAALAKVGADLPLLFMSMADVGSDTWGMVYPVSNGISPVADLAPPQCNYTAGATVIGAFEPSSDSNPEWEVFIAVGRAGEPLSTLSDPCDPGGPAGVHVLRFTTSDMKKYSDFVDELFLENGANPPGADRLGDGVVWTIKSVDRDAKTGTYVLFAFYGSQAFSFISTDVSKANSFKATKPGDKDKGNFDDHDDTNIIFDRKSREWVDMQIFFQNHTDPGMAPGTGRKYCDNSGCYQRRVVTYRTSSDAISWSDDAGCVNESRNGLGMMHCTSYNDKAIIQPDPKLDPPDLQFYRIRPFYLDDASGRLGAHLLHYAPGPDFLNENYPTYGYKPLKCGTNHLRPGVKQACHGPHMYEEFLSGPVSGVVKDIPGWRRDFRNSRFAPHDVWLMAQPVVFNDAHVFVDNGAVWQVPMYRFAGLFAPANGEFSTPSFEMPSTQLWMNADISWQGPLVTGGSDEGHAAYVMVELRDAKSGAVLPGYEKEKCVLMNTDGIKLPLKWKGTQEGAMAGTTVTARVYFRDSKIYAIGA